MSDFVILEDWSRMSIDELNSIEHPVKVNLGPVIYPGDRVYCNIHDCIFVERGPDFLIIDPVDWEYPVYDIGIV